MTNGYAGSKKFMNEVTDDKGNLLISDMSEDGNYVYRLIEDPKELEYYIKNSLLANSTDLTEHVDGAILGSADALLAASIFHFGEMTVAEVRKELLKAGLSVRGA